MDEHIEVSARATLRHAQQFRAAGFQTFEDDREVVDTYVRGAGTGTRWLGAAVRRAQTGNVQSYLSALLAGSLVLAIAAVLVAAGA